MLELRTGSRLHFGLMELAPNEPLRYGGLGLMLRYPPLVIRVSARAERHERDFAQPTRADNSEIQRRVQLTLARALNLCEPSSSSEPLNVEVVEHLPMHCGLGCGTQLASAVAAAVALAKRRCNSVGTHSHTDGTQPTQHVSDALAASELARLSGRGKRSGIGLHGFLYGGLVQDFGQSPAQCVIDNDSATRSLDTRSQSFPDEWRVVLLTRRDGGDMHGSQEDQLMQRAGQQPNAHRDEMLALSHAAMAAAGSMQFDGFVTALDRYMELAARLFASVQAGRYRNEQVAEAVRMAQHAGLHAVGQSSWGPTVFGFAPSQKTASQAANRLHDFAIENDLEVIVTEATATGATWQATRYGVQHAS